MVYDRKGSNLQLQPLCVMFLGEVKMVLQMHPFYTIDHGAGTKGGIKKSSLDSNPWWSDISICNLTFGFPYVVSPVNWKRKFLKLWKYKEKIWFFPHSVSVFPWCLILVRKGLLQIQCIKNPSLGDRETDPGPGGAGIRIRI